MSETVVMKELEKARMYYAPYADAWSKKRDQVDFEAQESKKETGEDVASVGEVNVIDAETDIEPVADSGEKEQTMENVEGENDDCSRTGQ